MQMPSHITTERLTLRPLAAQDLPGYVDYYTGNRTAGVGGAKPKHVVVERFYAMVGQWALKGFGRYAIAFDQTTPAFGHVGIMDIDPDAEPEMTWTLWDAQHTGQGYATEAAQASMDAYFAAGARHVIAVVDRDNEASIRVAERLGMTHDPAAVVPAWMPNGLRYVKEAA